MIKALSLDMGNVIEDTSAVEQNIIAMDEAILKRWGIRDEGVLSTVRNYRQELENSFGHKPFENRYFFWQDVLEILGVKPSNEKIHTVYDLYIDEYLKHVSIYDDVLPTLNWALTAGLQIVVVSNGTVKKAEAVLRKFDLEKYISCLFMSELVGSNKPLTLIFRYFLWKLRIDPEEAVHVGDRIDTDIKGAKAAGIHAVWLNRGKKRVARKETAGADAVIANLFEIKTTLEKAGW